MLQFRLSTTMPMNTNAVKPTISRMSLKSYSRKEKGIFSFVRQKIMFSRPLTAVKISDSTVSVTLR